MLWDDEKRKEIGEEAAGKTVKDLYYEADGDYWVMEFDDDTEIAIRFMAEIVHNERSKQAPQASDQEESA